MRSEGGTKPSAAAAEAVGHGAGAAEPLLSRITQTASRAPVRLSATDPQSSDGWCGGSEASCGAPTEGRPARATPVLLIGARGPPTAAVQIAAGGRVCRTRP